MIKTIVLGNDFDQRLRRALREVMREMGAKTLEKSWDVAGAVELATAKLELQGKIVDVESENYSGLAIIGDENQVDEIARRVAEKLKASGEGG
jgi:hypothetical protein